MAWYDKLDDHMGTKEQTWRNKYQNDGISNNTCGWTGSLEWLYMMYVANRNTVSNKRSWCKDNELISVHNTRLGPEHNQLWIIRLLMTACILVARFNKAQMRAVDQFETSVSKHPGQYSGTTPHRFDIDTPSFRLNNPWKIGSRFPRWLASNPAMSIVYVMGDPYYKKQKTILDGKSQANYGWSDIVLSIWIYH